MPYLHLVAFQPFRHYRPVNHIPFFLSNTFFSARQVNSVDCLLRSPTAQPTGSARPCRKLAQRVGHRCGRGGRPPGMPFGNHDVSPTPECPRGAIGDRVQWAVGPAGRSRGSLTATRQGSRLSEIAQGGSAETAKLLAFADTVTYRELMANDEIPDDERVTKPEFGSGPLGRPAA